MVHLVIQGKCVVIHEKDFEKIIHYCDVRENRNISAVKSVDDKKRERVAEISESIGEADLQDILDVKVADEAKLRFQDLTWIKSQLLKCVIRVMDAA